MIKPFKMDRYEDFIGDLPADILRLVPRESRTTFWRELKRNLNGKVILGWKVENGIPIPIVQSLQISAKGTF